jgi:hypothetical protein
MRLQFGDFHDFFAGLDTLNSKVAIRVFIDKNIELLFRLENLKRLALVKDIGSNCSTCNIH